MVIGVAELSLITRQLHVNIRQNSKMLINSEKCGKLMFFHSIKKRARIVARILNFAHDHQFNIYSPGVRCTLVLVSLSVLSGGFSFVHAVKKVDFEKNASIRHSLNAAFSGFCCCCCCCC